ncbi:cytochrome P450 15A1 [Tribolium castaneum]|uniref:Cytochrome P450 15A1 n=1 Tax=Tribolium castaneum TaxID=7070 RepID=D6WFY6_TRICA|nr:cytochrome P450 15A1 [Tribolium castaneum]|eukprot:XP_970303.1 PREDICTED: methyl farnesoate epoxidase [Tribolium castaneum]
MLFFVTLVISLVLLFLILDTIKPRRYPPGPKWLPIVGNFLEFRRRLSEIGYHHLVWKEFSEEYGDVVGLKMGRNLVVAVFGAEAVKEVLTREEFDGRPDGFFFRLRTFGKRLGIVFSDGQFWQKQRKFSMQHLRNFGFGRKEMEEKIEEETKDLIAVFKKQCSEPIWMHTAFDVSVLNVLWAMMAGERFNINDERLRKLLKIVHDAFRLTDMSGGMLNQLPFLRFIAPETCGYNQLVDVLVRMWEFLQETISEHRKTLCSSHARDLIDAFLQKMDIQSDSSFTDDQLMSLCLDLFMAGSETTSNTLGFSVVYMLQFPEVQKKVQDEMDEVVGRNRWPTLQDRIKLKYTEAVLMEIQRRANIPPLGIAHRATRDVSLFDYRIPEGTIVLTSLYSVHMDHKFWKDPLAFRPERFLNKEGNLEVDEKYFAPFGYGKRRCLGESLAKANYFLFFTALLHNFYLEKDCDGPEPQLEGYDGVTISPKPFRAKLIPRTD